MIEKRPRPSSTRPSSRSPTRAPGDRLQQRHPIAAADSREIAVGQKQRFVALKADDRGVERLPCFAVNAAHGPRRARASRKSRDGQTDDPRDVPARANGSRCLTWSDRENERRSCSWLGVNLGAKIEDLLFRNLLVLSIGNELGRRCVRGCVSSRGRR